MNAAPTTMSGEPVVLFDIDLEQALIGACLVDATVASGARGLCREHDFMDPLHQRIWCAIGDLMDRDFAATPITVAAHLSADKGLSEVGGRQYLASLAMSAPPRPNYADYARLLADLAIRRRADAELEAARSRLGTQSATPLECLAGVIEVAGIAAEREAKNAGYQPIAEALDEVMREAEAAGRGEEPPHVKTALADLDVLLGGMQSGDMIVAAGRPGSGKTVLLGTAALNAAKAGHPVVIFELEMRRKSILHRLICDIDYDLRGSELPLSYSRMRAMKLWSGEFERMFAAQQILRQLPITIFDTAGMTLDEISAHAGRIATKAKTLGLIIIDYLQIVVPSDRYAGGKVAEVTEISNGLKRMAKRIGWPAIAACQLNRAVETRNEKDRRPTLADLRESGAIEQDADIVIGLHRPAYYVQRKRPEKGKSDPGWLEWLADVEQCKNDLDLLVLKNRSGPDGHVKAFVDIGASAIRNRSGTQESGGEAAEGLLI